MKIKTILNKIPITIIIINKNSSKIIMEKEKISHIMNMQDKETKRTITSRFNLTNHLRSGECCIKYKLNKILKY